MIALEDDERMTLIDPDEQHRAVVILLAQPVTQGLDLGDKIANAAAEVIRTDAASDLGQPEIAVADLAPVGAGEDANAFYVCRFQADAPPFRIGRQLAPHVSTAAEQQRAAHGVLQLVSEIRVEHN